MSLKEQIESHIDDIILSTEDSFSLFKTYLKLYSKDEVNSFLQSLYMRLEISNMDNSIREYCETENGIEYVYGEVDKPANLHELSDLPPTRSELELKDVYKRTAFENWYNRKFEEANRIISFIQSTKVKLKDHCILGLDSKFSEDELSKLFKLLQGRYISQLVSERNFVNCLSNKTLKSKPQIQWISDNSSFYYFVYRLHGFLNDSNYAFLIERNELFLTKAGIPFKARKISSKKSEYTTASNLENSYYRIPPSASDIDLIIASI